MREGGEEGRRGHKAPEVGSCKNRLDPGRISHGLSTHLPIPAGVSAGRHCWTKALGGEGEDSEQGAEGCEVQRCSGAAVQCRCPHLIHSRSIDPLLPPCPPVSCPCHKEIDRLGQGRRAVLSLSLVLAPTPTHTHPRRAYTSTGMHTGLLVHPASPPGQRIGQADPLPSSL